MSACRQLTLDLSPCLPAGIFEGTDLARVYVAIRDRGPVPSASIATVVSMETRTIRYLAGRLCSDGHVHSKRIDDRPHWCLGPGPYARRNPGRVIGLVDAIRNLLANAPERMSIHEIAAALGSDEVNVRRAIGKLSAAHEIASSLHGKAGERRYGPRARRVVPSTEYGFIPGDGERFECVRTDACLDAFIGAGQAHCPKACPGFAPIPRDALIAAATMRRTTMWDDVERFGKCSGPSRSKGRSDAADELESEDG